MRKFVIVFSIFIVLFLAACQQYEYTSESSNEDLTVIENTNGNINISIRPEILYYIPIENFIDVLEISQEDIVVSEDESVLFSVSEYNINLILKVIEESFLHLESFFLDFYEGVEEIYIDNYFQELIFYVNSMEEFLDKNELEYIFEFDFYDLGILSYVYAKFAQIELGNGFIVRFFDNETQELSDIYYRFLDFFEI